MKEHSLTHTDEKPYHCGICDFTFSRADTVKEHMDTHNFFFT